MNVYKALLQTFDRAPIPSFGEVGEWRTVAVMVIKAHDDKAAKKLVEYWCVGTDRAEDERVVVEVIDFDSCPATCLWEDMTYESR